MTFDDSETWALNLTFAEFLVPRLKRFKELHPCYPIGLTFDEWDKIIQEMIDGFENFANNHEIDPFSINWDKANRALELFQKYFKDLWW